MVFPRFLGPPTRCGSRRSSSDARRSQVDAQGIKIRLELRVRCSLTEIRQQVFLSGLTEHQAIRRERLLQPIQLVDLPAQRQHRHVKGQRDFLVGGQLTSISADT